MSSIVKVIELIAQSPTSWEDAVNTAIDKAGKTVHGIKSVYVKDFEAKVENQKIVGYRVILKVSFALD